jgi:hypothetical protein
MHYFFNSVVLAIFSRAVALLASLHGTPSSATLRRLSDADGRCTIDAIDHLDRMPHIVERAPGLSQIDLID